MKTTLKSLIIIGLFLAQSSALASAKPLPHYQIEVIVFEHLRLAAWTDEHWPADIELPNFDQDKQLQDIPTSVNTAESTTENAPQLFFPALSDWQLLPPSQTPDMNLLWQKLKQSKGYRPLAQFAWQQPTDIKQKAQSVFLHSPASPLIDTSSVMGNITVYKNRFAHIHLNLLLERTIPTAVREPFAQQQRIPIDELADVWSFTLNQSHKLKLDQLLYIDHPIFGVLVKVVAVSKEQ